MPAGNETQLKNCICSRPSGLWGHKPLTWFSLHVCEIPTGKLKVHVAMDHLNTTISISKFEWTRNSRSHTSKQTFSTLSTKQSLSVSFLTVTHRQNGTYSRHLPMHVWPSLPNWYPSSHSQRKVPGRLLQMAWEPQIWGSSLHSSMSANKIHNMLMWVGYCRCGIKAFVLR